MPENKFLADKSPVIAGLAMVAWSLKPLKALVRG
jgi:hypothetical protein